MASVRIDLAEDRYRLPLEQHCRSLDEATRTNCEFVPLGSLATPKYLKPVLGVFGQRLLFPDEFVGRGDFSRGGLMLRCAREGLQLKYSLKYSPIGKLTEVKENNRDKLGTNRIVDLRLQSRSFQDDMHRTLALDMLRIEIA
jgi:hypothetical protein